MSDFETPLPDGLANRAPRLACCILLDTSWSMNENGLGGRPRIELAQEGLQSLKNWLINNPRALDTVEVSLVTFGPQAQPAIPFGPVDEFDIPQLTADGGTPMAEAIQLGMDLVEHRLSEYENDHLKIYKPWFCVITDGFPTSNAQDWQAAVQRINGSKMTIVAMSVVNDAQSHAKIYELTKNSFDVSNVPFDEIFEWLSKSLITASNATPGEKGDSEPLPEGTSQISFEVDY